MPESAPRRAILASHSVTRPVEVDRLNAILEDAGLGSPLGPPEPGTSAVAVLPVVSGDPQEIVNALRRAEGDHFENGSDGYRVDTVDPGGKTKLSPPPTEPLDATEFQATGLKSGHGTVTWTPIEQYEAPHQPPWPPAGARPVVVVLDSGVRQHDWLPHGTDPSFCIFPPYPLPVPDDAGDFGAYWGHATFLAGLIRLKAPAAQVASLRVMSNDGTLDPDRVVTALRWLHDEYMDKQGGRVDVVLMAFGRPKKPGESNPSLLTQRINELGRKRVQFVASAGNDHSHTETIPACLAADPDSPIVSVGAGTSAADHEPYSNHGPWVREWRPGTHVSLMPLTARGKNANGYAVWSGTSFSAAIYAGELAQARAGERAASPGS